MPPKKRGRPSTRRESTGGPDEDATMVDTPEIDETPGVTAEPKQERNNISTELWTDEQETSLFKGIIRWKPAGIHKHFRMIAISEHLRNHGYDPKFHTHTRIPEIWKKLDTLYNLEVIDERENSFDYPEDSAVEQKYLPFNLPEDEYGNMMWERGMAPSNASSPSRLHERSGSAEHTKRRRRGENTAATKRLRASTIEDTDEAKTSPATSPVPPRTKRGRPPKNAPKPVGRSSSRAKAGRGDRHTSKETAEDEEDEEDEDGVDAMDVDEGGEEEGEEGQGAGGEEEDEDEEADSDDGGTPSPRLSRSAAKGTKTGVRPRGQSTSRKSSRLK